MRIKNMSIGAKKGNVWLEGSVRNENQTFKKYMQGLRGNKVNLKQKHELVARAEGVYDHLAGTQDQQAKLHRQEIFNDRQTFSTKVNLSPGSQAMDQTGIPGEASTSSTKTVIVTGTEIKPQDLSILEDIDLSALPGCDTCFRCRRKRIGRRPCQSCRVKKSITIIRMPLAYTLDGLDSRSCRHRSQIKINSIHCEHHLPSPGCYFAAPRSPFLSRSFCN